MTTVSDENGIINNFAKEPTMYYAAAPSSQDQRSYLIWGVLALIVVVASVFTATVVG